MSDSDYAQDVLETFKGLASQIDVMRHGLVAEGKAFGTGAGPSGRIYDAVQRASHRCDCIMSDLSISGELVAACIREYEDDMERRARATLDQRQRSQ